MPEPRRSESNLEDVIALIASQARHQGARLTRTKLVKLLYFVDLRAWETFGRAVTGVEWVWHHYGPYSSTVVETCNRMAANDELEIEEGSNYFGSPEYRIRSQAEMYH